MVNMVNTATHGINIRYMPYIYGTSALPPRPSRLQSVLNSAARLILRIGKYDPNSAAIRRDLHWLPIQFRIQYN